MAVSIAGISALVLQKSHICLPFALDICILKKSKFYKGHLYYLCEKGSTGEIKRIPSLFNLYIKAKQDLSLSGSLYALFVEDTLVQRCDQKTSKETEVQLTFPLFPPRKKKRKIDCQNTVNFTFRNSVLPATYMFDFLDRFFISLFEK